MRKQSYHFFLRIKKFPVFCTSYAINVFSQYQTRIIVLLKSNESSTYKVIRLWGKSYSRRTAGVTEKNATFAFSQKTHTNATFK